MLHRKKNSDPDSRRSSSRDKQLPDWDDGRTVANMNIDGLDGMSWGSRQPGSVQGSREKRPEDEPPSSGEMLSGRDLRRVIFSATMIGVGVALVFVAAAFLLIQLMLLVWT